MKSLLPLASLLWRARGFRHSAIFVWSARSEDAVSRCGSVVLSVSLLWIQQVIWWMPDLLSLSTYQKVSAW
ncbi:hypothetical protein NE237_016316 [Protea cynaroides]|uniref:Uncharacterized protein n=1 Tax=Protea cynaroides TaxID=273540 RepID=A0A9Q0GLN8_9MAGN|nr:hypothetical protein NE237_016316 [Protea cynaroides]